MLGNAGYKIPGETETIMLTEINQSQKDIYHMFSLI